MKPLYRYSAETARHDGELDYWRESRNENIRCRDFLDEQIAKRFDGMSLPNECVENTTEQCGSLQTPFRTAKATADFTTEITNGQSVLIFPMRIGITNLQ